MATKNNKPKSKSKKFGLIIALSALTALAVFVIYFLYSFANSLKQDSSALKEALISNSYVVKEDRTQFKIEPKNSNQKAIILYPGAFAMPSAYIATFTEIAKDGTTIFVLKSPLNFALLNTNLADKVILDNNQIKDWYIAGHSLGGVAACDYTKSHQNKLKGLILLASFCNGDAKYLQLPVLSISGSLDGLTDKQDVEKSRLKLPAQTQYVIVEGGNHTQFGAFEKLQPGDNKATISQQEQIEQIQSSIEKFISS